MRGLFEQKTFLQLCSEDCKLLIRTIKELIPAVRGPRLWSIDVWFLSFFFIAVHYGKKKKWHVSLFLQNLYSKLLFNVPSAPCVRATTVVFSQETYTPPSIILFLTVFHYCLRKEASHAQLAPLSTDNFKVKFTGFPAMICLLPILSGRNKKSWCHTTFSGSTSLKWTNKQQVISTVLEISTLTMTQGAFICLWETQNRLPGSYPSFRNRVSGFG